MSGQEIQNDLKQAFEEEQFVVYLQPKFNLATEDVTGAEALVRWMHPDRGLLLPEEFIPYMDDSGQIIQLDHYVWEKTCQLIHDWFVAGKLPYSVSVNVSEQSLMSEQLTGYLVGLISRYGISPSFLQLEITEKAYMNNPEAVSEALRLLHDIGFSIILDDFGSGCSSLNTLKLVQIDAIKIDMAYLPIRDRTENDEIILVSVIKMSNWLGMSVIAEGVETRRQRDFLQGAGCDCVQGHYFSEAVPVSEYEAKYVYHTLTDHEEEAEEADGFMPKYNMTILVVDDDELSREILYQIFRDLYHVHRCSSAEEALAYLKDNMMKVKLILLDNFMPGMSGIEFLKFCKLDNELRVIPQIMITSGDDDEVQLEAFRAGAYDYITKPFTREIVMARVIHVMEISCRTSIFDIIEQKYKQKPELDAATSLLNKVAFNDLSARLIEMFPEEQQALFVIDIDDFKKVNDKHGHLVGDKVIRCVADELTNAFRKTDLIGRFGGDEFVVLMTKIQSQKTARLKAAEVIKSVLFECVKQFNINTNLSIGLAFSEKGDTLGMLFSRADQALYEAKNTGKGKTVVYGEAVPCVADDDQSIVLVYSEDRQIYSTIAHAYEEGAGFINIKNSDELKRIDAQYGDRISVICVDFQEGITEQIREIYQLIQNSVGLCHIRIVAICRESDMTGLREALALPIHDILMLPPQIGTIERILSKCIMERNGN